MYSADKEIILVDGTSFLFRAYHALRRNPLTTADGRTTQAIFGMVNMLRSLLKECQPTHIAVVMDAKGKTFRHDLYDAYKANRPPMPDDLREQLEYVKKIIPAMGLPLISISGVEADDVIGTLSVQATAQGFRSIIVSSDKDLTQLVNDKVEMVDTMKNTRLDVAGVKKKFGVLPQRIIEYLALIGDNSDNIPGIPKVGPKTAVKWFDEYGTLDEIVKNADKIAGKVGESLRDNIGQLELSKKLTTIKCDVELDCSPNDLALHDADDELLRAYYTDLEFRSWLKEIEPPNNAADRGDEKSGASDSNAIDYHTIWDEQTLDQWMTKLRKSKIFALDTETTSVDAHRAHLVGISFSVAQGEAAYLPLGHNYAGVPKQLPLKQTLERLRPIFEDPKQAKTGQNLKYDTEVLQNHGIYLQGATHDTMLISYLLDAGNSRHDMNTLALKHLGKQTISFSEVAGSGKKQLTFDQVAIEIATSYAAEDADITLQLHHALLPELEKNPALNKLFHDIEMPLMSALVRTETNGVKIDSLQLKKQSAEIAKRLVEIEKKAYSVAGEEFNIASPKQIQEILYRKTRYSGCAIKPLRDNPPQQKMCYRNWLKITLFRN